MISRACQISSQSLQLTKSPTSLPYALTNLMLMHLWVHDLGTIGSLSYQPLPLRTHLARFQMKLRLLGELI